MPKLLVNLGSLILLALLIQNCESILRVFKVIGLRIRLLVGVVWPQRIDNCVLITASRS